MRRFALILALPLLLLGCDYPPDTIAGRIQAGVIKACAFKADYAWLTDVVTKADVTAQMIDQFVIHVCEKVTTAQSDAVQGLMTPKCPYGEIVIDDIPVCIEGAPVEPKEEK